MGGKSKYLILLTMIMPLAALSQNEPDFRSIDSVTYRLYLDNEWDSVIKKGNEAIESGIDFKFLRQRLGRAYFEKGDFLRAAKHLSKALAYDSYNPFTIEYLHYSYLNLGKQEYAGLLGKRIAHGAGDTFYSRGPFRLIEKIDLEFDYKRTSTTLRSDASFYRIGMGTRAGYRVGIYQSFSKYTQTVNKYITSDTTAFAIRQPGYYFLVNWNVSHHLMLRSAYHYLYIRTGDQLDRGHLFHFAAVPDFGSFSFEVNGSMTITEGDYLYQAGMTAAYLFPGTRGFYLKGAAAWLTGDGEYWFAYGPSAGIKLWKGAFAEGTFITGRLDRYNDFNGMYVYNTYDPMIGRAGITLHQIPGSRLSIWINYSVEKKEYFEDNSYTYKQFSFLGGIRWKI